MATYIKINGEQYPASITGKLSDSDWGNRKSKTIHLTMDYFTALNLFVNDVSWSILQEIEKFKNISEEITDEETGDIRIETKLVPEIVLEEYDNREYSIAGEIIDHRDGTISVKMGEPTAEELLAILEEVL